MTKIDWVEVPAGKSLIGLSKEQKEIVRERILLYCGVDVSDQRAMNLIEKVKEKRRQYAASRTQEELLKDLRQGLGAELSPEERAVDERFSDVFAVEAALWRVEQRVVKLNTFYIARFPITNAQWAEHYGKRSPRYPKIPEAANWYRADRFCHEVGGRLPTEAEWEKAARGAEGQLYPWGNEWDLSRGNFVRDIDAPGQVSGTWMSLVDAYPSGVSPYGVWDMCGNVYEWTMTAAWIDDEECYVKKAWPVKYDDSILWFDHLLFRRWKAAREKSFYTGFRPVLDEWARQHWTGFRGEVGE